MEMKDAKETLGLLGIGLSRLLRYTYAGCLFIILVCLFNKFDLVKLKDIPVPATIIFLFIIIIGAAVYAFHRSLTTLISHLLLCVVFQILERWLKRPPEKSCSPTRWLGKVLLVPFSLRIYAYDIIRGSKVFGEDERNAMNIAHAESHLMTMTSVGFFVAGIYLKKFPLLLIGVALWGASLPMAIEQHSIECLEMRSKKKQVENILRDAGIID